MNDGDGKGDTASHSHAMTFAI